jgi:hypothetical protein
VESGISRGRLIVPGLAVALIAVLAVLAFRNGFSLLSPTGLVALDNSTFTGNFDITKTSVTIPADHATVKVSAPEPVRIITKSNDMNGTGSFLIEDFAGIITSDGKTLQLVGDMESINGERLSIKFNIRQSTTMILKAGSMEATNVNMTVFSRDLTGSIRLENRWTIKLNQTPVSLRDYKGKVHMQRIGNTTTMMMDGNADNLKIEQKNFIKNVA